MKVDGGKKAFKNAARGKTTVLPRAPVWHSFVRQLVWNGGTEPRLYTGECGEENEPKLDRR